jgi:tetratricopeptide (TPR) repeat protein
MSERTQRLRIEEGPPTVLPAATPAPPADVLPLTLVSNRDPGAPIVPVAFPGFEILGELGRGGMGVVYKARQRNLNRLVALKVILGGPLASDEDKGRFRTEAEAAARLHHPNIVQVYDVGEHAGFSYMALELIEGQTLRQWHGGARTDPKQAAKMVGAVARAIHHAHEQGIVHRDIKPANVLLAPVSAAHPELGATSGSLPTVATSAVSRAPSSGHNVALPVTPKITDFGLAKALDGGRDLTVTGVACGTPNYMAPEQVRGQAVTPGVDVYGLGAVLFELLAGRPPFAGTDAAEVMGQILRADAPDVRKFAPAVPRDLAVVVAKCLEKSPAARYASARDAADDLDRFLSGKPIAARPVGRAERVWRWVKRNPVVTAFLLVATLGCCATGGLAVALARTARDEHQAREAAEAARADAEGQHALAERRGADVLHALFVAEEARRQADCEKAAADRARDAATQEAERAGEKEREADAARALAEDNLRVARGVIRVSLRELSRHPRFEEDDFRGARVTLIAQARSFRDAVSRHAPNAAEWLDDLADVSHWLGFLEYLNNNQTGAAAEYRRAAEAAGKWAALEPDRPEPRARQSFSLVNAGNAQVNARRYPDAEAAYREAVRLIDAVAAARPRDGHYRAQAVEASGRLANLFRIWRRPVEWEAAARAELDRADALVRECGPAAEHRALAARAHLTLAQALAARQQWADAERHFAAAVRGRDELRAERPGAVRWAFEYGAALLAQAEFLAGRGAADRAGDAFRTAVEVMEKGQAAAPSVNAHCAELAAAWVQYADFLRGRTGFAEAERRYNQALDLAAAVTRGAPSFRPAREAWVSAATGRAHLYNATGRHHEAAAEWARLAADDPDPGRRPRHELYVSQSLLFAGAWAPACLAAEAQMMKDQPGWMWADLGRVWCLAHAQIEADPDLDPDLRPVAAAVAIHQAVACLKKARALGEFAKPQLRKWYDSGPEFAPVRDRFDPDRK